MLSLWAFSPKVKRWVLLMPELRGQAAVDEMIARQDRVRRTGYDTVFKLLPPGEEPDP